MSNLSVNNFRTLRLRIDKSYYWDFFINKDRLDSGKRSGGMSTDSLSAYIDMTAGFTALQTTNGRMPCQKVS